jgi:uncharacterized protein (DUF1800 family)
MTTARILRSRMLPFVIAVAAVAGCASQMSQTERRDMSNGSAMRRNGDRDLNADEEIRHALSRLTFGPKPGDAARVRAMGVDKWIDAQLDPSTISDTLADRVLAGMETQHKRVFELIADHPDAQEVQARFNRVRAMPGGKGVSLTRDDSAVLRHAGQVAAQLTAQLQSARVVRAVASERQLQEVMTDFWENHFSVFIGKMPNRYAISEYDRDVIRPRALGKFRDLLGAVAKSPEMLYYLDNYQSYVDSLHPTIDEQRIEARRSANTADALVQQFATLPRRRGRGVNENYARELMELHTLGVDGGYTQADVQEVARALTGWTIEAPNLGGGFIFRPEQHDAGAKTVLGHHLSAGREQQDGEDVLDIIASAPATAHYITLKLARHFVSDDPPPMLVDRCAAKFSASAGDIRETLRCIVTSPEFFSRAAYRAKVKTPFELVVSALRAIGAAPDTSARTAQAIAQLGQPIYGRLTPDGWPDRGDAWMNSGAILSRINFGFRVAAGQLPGVRIASWPAAVRLRGAPADKQVDGVVDELLGGDVSADTRRILISGENPMLAAAPQPKSPVPQLTGLAAIVALALGSPEFQRR